MLVDQIREHGQIVPILVRPHPEIRGRFQVAYGHCRLTAAQTLGRRVRAIVRVMTDTELVVAQGQENSVRSDLSYIERALFALSLEARGFDRVTIMSALRIDKTELSRLLSVLSRIPRDLIDAIGSAPGIGRTRWLAFSQALADPDALSRVRSLTSGSTFLALGSDERFTAVLEKAEARPTKKPRSSPVTFDGLEIGSVSRARTDVVFRFDIMKAEGFADYVHSQLSELYTAWKTQRGM